MTKIQEKSFWQSRITKEIEDRFYRELEFGTGGMRGVIGAGTNRMNKYTIRKAAQGLANYLEKQGIADKGVAIAYDSVIVQMNLLWKQHWLWLQTI